MAEVTPKQHNRLHDYAKRLEQRIAELELQMTRLQDDARTSRTALDQINSELRSM